MGKAAVLKARQGRGLGAGVAKTLESLVEAWELGVGTLEGY